VKLSDATLMLYHDRELELDVRRRVEVGRLVDSNVNRRLDALAELGAAVRAWAARAGVDAAEERRRHERARVRRRALAACAAVVLSAAALPCLAVHGARGTKSSVSAAAAEVAVENTLPARAPEAVAVETVDFGARAGTIFSVPGSAASETTVVWLPDDTEGTRGGAL
jgi:hypothetical protein